MSRHVRVNQEVLDTFFLSHSQRSHSVTSFADRHRERHPHPVGVEVTDRVARLEARGITAAGRNAQLRQDGRVGRSNCARIAAAGLRGLKPILGARAAHDAALDRRRQRSQGIRIGDPPGQLLGLLLEKAVLVSQDPGSLRQQATSRRVESIDGGQDCLAQPVAGKLRIVVARISAWRQSSAREITLDFGPLDLEQRPGQIRVAMAHACQPSRTAAPQQVQQQRLDLVVPGMAKRDAAAAGVSGGSPEKLIASLASRRLGARQARSGAAADVRIPPAPGELLNEARIGGAFRPPAVVEVRNGEAQGQVRHQFAQEGKQRNRVRAA